MGLISQPDWLTCDVSRETLNALADFCALVRKWSDKINLVSRKDLENLEERHLWDSVQIWNHRPVSGHWVDLGSGGGFPGIVIATLANHDTASFEVTMVESDARKCAFLRTAVRELGLTATIKHGRIEDIPPLQADVVSARALSNLDTLLGFSVRHVGQMGKMLFPKGEHWKKEVEQAQHNWRFDHTAHTSFTNPNAAVLEVKNVRHT